MSDNVQAAQTPEKTGAVGEIVEIVKTVFYALLIALVLRVLLFQPFTIPSASMEPNLYQGDYIIVSKFSYGYSRHSIPFSPPLFDGRILGKPAERGDIVVFKLPRDGRTDYVKRVIGLPGDRVQMKDGLLYLNGQQVQRQFAGTRNEDTGFGFVRDVANYRETLPGGRSFLTSDFGTDGELDNTEVFVVPEGHYFMMGDNRDGSDDSRRWGFVPERNLVGKAFFIWMSWDGERFRPDLSRIGNRIQ